MGLVPGFLSVVQEGSLIQVRKNLTVDAAWHRISECPVPRLTLVVLSACLPSIATEIYDSTNMAASMLHRPALATHRERGANSTTAVRVDDEAKGDQMGRPAEPR